MARGSAPTGITLHCSPVRATATSRSRDRSPLRSWNMHILVTADTLGGVWTYTRELVTGLALGRDRVTLVSFGDIPTDAQTRWMQNLPNLDYRPTAFKLEWMLDSEADMEASSRDLEAVIAESKPDLLHFSQFYYGTLNCDVPRVVVAHSDVVSWSMAVHRKSPPETAWLRWYRQVVVRGLHAATTVVAPSRWMLDQIELHYGKLASASVIHNGRTQTLFNPHISKQENIVTMGRLWDSGKNVSLLLRREMPGTLRIVGCDRHPEWRNRTFAMETVRPNVHLGPARVFMPPLRNMNPLVWRRWRPRSRAAPSWPVTFLHSASSGMARQFSSAATTKKVYLPRWNAFRAILDCGVTRAIWHTAMPAAISRLSGWLPVIRTSIGAWFRRGPSAHEAEAQYRALCPFHGL